MAIIKTRQMNRPNGSSNLFENLGVELTNYNITSAEDLLNQFDNIQYPLDLNLILNRFNLHLETKELPDDISGILDLNNNTITVEQRHSKERQHFTIAHEIAHFCLHKNQDSLFEDKIFFRGIDSNSIECQANNFAGELLMPKCEFLSQIKKGNKTIVGLAEYFGVSTLAIRVRAKNLNLTGHGL